MNKLYFAIIMFLVHVLIDILSWSIINIFINFYLFIMS